MNALNQKTEINATFWLHLLVTLLAWAGPFLFSWQLMVLAYGLVQLQFWFFGKCLMNEHHDLSEKDDYTFYAYLFEYLGFNFDRKIVKNIVRNGLYIFFGIFAYCWQVVLKNEAILF